jgi:hypothetical protein
MTSHQEDPMSETVEQHKNESGSRSPRASRLRRGRVTSLLAAAVVAAVSTALLPSVLSPASAQPYVTSAQSARTVVVRSAGPAARHRYFCHGRRATIVGTGHADVLRGTRRADVIVGLGGNDIILGGQGRDLICGGSGADMLNAMQGSREPLYGGAGTDFCFAPDAAEHRFHFQCEAHLPSRVASRRLATLARGVLGAATRGRSPAKRLVAPARRVNAPATVSAGKTKCESYDVGAPTNANIADAHGDLYATGAWTVPSKVGVVPVYWTWTSNGWSVGVQDSASLRIWSIDAYDGTTSTFPLRMTLPATNARFFVGYYFMWMNPNTGAWDKGGLNFVTNYADTLYGYGGGDDNLGFCYTALQR